MPILVLQNAVPPPRTRCCHCKNHSLLSIEIDAFQRRKWPASLPFNGFWCSPLDNIAIAGHCSYRDEVDLFEDVRNNIFRNINVRFDPAYYAVDNKEGWNEICGGWKLITTLCAAS